MMRACFLTTLGASWAFGALADTAWDIQFAPPFAYDRPVAVMDLDGEFTPAPVVALLRKRGVTPICYVSVGTWEAYRWDADQFPDEVLGRIWPDWPDERYIDIRELDLIRPIIRARFETCRAKGFAGVEADIQDLHWAESGFDISKEDQIAYSRALAQMAHEIGLTFGQKNSPDLVPYLVNYADFIVTEDCFADGWCEATAPYIAAQKPVFAIEYTDTAVDFSAACKYGANSGLAFILKDRDLNGGTYSACNEGSGGEHDE